ncbi:hypothetical protein C4D60_Mb06t15630 [Musa balbisiana]|uniref:Uncharacterized protein n=1 Tax=Musa balbisiana TaxID=52838 RepID=A0A4S8INC5_MUSBA|nr:hypothetical protein C4D60_Mb06t15630 [Musa balbisiana]
MMPLQCCRFDISYYHVYGVAAVLMTNEQSFGLVLQPYMVKKAVDIPSVDLLDLVKLVSRSTAIPRALWSIARHENYLLGVEGDVVHKRRGL